jgi:hypothetical protein
MRIVDIREHTVSIASDIKNAYIDSRDFCAFRRVRRHNSREKRIYRLHRWPRNRF